MARTIYRKAKQKPRIRPAAVYLWWRLLQTLRIAK